MIDIALPPHVLARPAIIIPGAIEQPAILDRQGRLVQVSRGLGLPGAPVPVGMAAAAAGATISIQPGTGVGYAGTVYESTSAGQWTANGSNISGQTGTTYTMELAYEGQRISQVGALNGHELFVPQDITGWVTSFDAILMDIRRNITETAGAVSQWDDVDGNFAFVQATGSAQPTYSATSFNSGPGISFDGGDYLRNAAFSALPTSRTWVGFVKSITGNANPLMVGPNAGNFEFRWHNAGTKWRVMPNGNAPGALVNLTSALGGDVDQMLGVRFTDSGGAYDLHENGASIGSGTTTANAFSGTDNGVDIGNGHDGSIGSHVVLDANVSAGDFDKIHGYLAHANGHAGLLDSGHTYKSTPPTVEAL